MEETETEIEMIGIERGSVGEWETGWEGKIKRRNRMYVHYVLHTHCTYDFVVDAIFFTITRKRKMQEKEEKEEKKMRFSLSISYHDNRNTTLT